MPSATLCRMGSIVKKWQKLARVGKSNSSKNLHSMDHNSDSDPDEFASVPEGFEVVYIGKSKRRFIINGQHLKHPLFKTLQERSEKCGVDQSEGLALGCEVVLFEHLLWLLDSNDPAISQGDSVQELADLYMHSEENALRRLLQAEGAED